jgi:hypothetical protein
MTICALVGLSIRRGHLAVVRSDATGRPGTGVVYGSFGCSRCCAPSSPCLGLTQRALVSATAMRCMYNIKMP